jgi:hypothetical protein
MPPGWSPAQLPDLNPPHFHALLLPLMGFDVARAFVVWAIDGFVCVVASVLIVASELRVRWTVEGVVWTIIGASAAAATSATFLTGQLTFLMLLPLVLAWRAARRNGWDRAAKILGVLASLKVFIAIFGVYLLWTKRWRACAWMAGSCAATVAVGVLGFGVRPYLDWIHALGTVAWTWSSMNASLAGLFNRALDGAPQFTPLVYAPSVAGPLSALASAGLVLLTFRGIRRDSTDVDRDFTMLLLLSVLVSPLGWVYYFWFFAAPAAGLWTATDRLRRPRRTLWIALGAVGFFCPIAATVWFADSRWAGATLGSAYAWSALCFWIAAAGEPSPSRSGV